MQTYSAFVIETGELTGRKITGDAWLRAINTAPGEDWIEGDYDHLSQRVAWAPDDFGNSSVAVVVAYQPAAPAATEWATWSWDAIARRWLPVPTLAALKQQAAAPVLKQLAELDVKVVRPAGEIAQAWAEGLPPPAAAALRLSGLNAEKAALRQLLLQIEAATTVEQIPNTTPPAQEPPP